jgi:hypothetical protein
VEAVEARAVAAAVYLEILERLERLALEVAEVAVAVPAEVVAAGLIQLAEVPGVTVPLVVTALLLLST